MSVQYCQRGKLFISVLFLITMILFSGHSFSMDPGIKLILKRKAVFQLKDDVFGRLRDGAENSKGEVFLLDSKRYKVFRFSREGELLDSFGQKGEGPGDLKNPFALMIFGNDDIAVECFPYRLSLFKTDGAFSRLFNLNAVDNRISRAHTIGPDRWCAVRKGDNQTLTMDICDFTGKVLGTPVRTIPDPSFQNSGVIINYRVEATTPAFLFAHFMNFSACARNDEYSISMLDENGSLVRTFSLPMVQKKLTKKEIDYIEIRVRKNMARIAKRPGMKKVVDKAVQQILHAIPPQKIIISSMILGERHLFVQRMADDISQTETPMWVDIFALKGSYLGKVSMIQWPLFCGRDAFYFVEGDNEGGTRVVKMDYQILLDES